MSFENTGNFKEYTYYKKLKSSLNLYYKGIDLSKCLALDLIEIIVCGQNKTNRDIGDALFRRLETQKIKKAFAQNKTVFSFDIPKRKDHLELATTIQKEIDNSALLILSYKFIYFCNIFSFIKSWFFVTSRIKASLKNKLYLTARLVYFKRMINSLNRCFTEETMTDKIYIPFNSTAYNEAALTLFFNQKGAKTYNLFHGLFGRYKTYIPNDIVNGENINTQIILAFSRIQKEDLIRDFDIDETKIFVAGNPKYPQKEICIKKDFSSCIILGGIPDYDKALAELLPILNGLSDKMQIKFHLKPHPLSKIASFSETQQADKIELIDKSQTIKHLFESNKYNFAITHNTSAYYESLYYGILPIRWAKQENLLFEVLDYSFDTAEGFQEVIKRLQDENSDKLNKQASNLLERAMGVGINNYKDLIK